jgi:hypothetical protein
MIYPNFLTKKKETFLSPFFSLFCQFKTTHYGRFAEHEDSNLTSQGVLPNYTNVHYTCASVRCLFANSQLNEFI